MPYHHFRRGPRRLIWFILGGVAATWWMKHKEMRTHERYMGHCVRRQPVQPASPPEMNGDTSQQNQNQSQNTPPPPPPPASRTQWGGNAEAQYQSPTANPTPPPMPFGWSNQQWEEEKEKMWAMGRQAGDTASELSEATLEHVLSTVETLKAKLAEHRAEREQQRKLFEQQMEEQKKEPRHYV